MSIGIIIMFVIINMISSSSSSSSSRSSSRSSSSSGSSSGSTNVFGPTRRGKRGRRLWGGRGPLPLRPRSHLPNRGPCCQGAAALCFMSCPPISDLMVKTRLRPPRSCMLPTEILTSGIRCCQRRLVGWWKTAETVLFKTSNP